MKQKRIALVVPALANSGGVTAVAEFIHHTVSTVPRDYTIDVISLATAFNDDVSVRITSPGSVFVGPRTYHGDWHGRPYIHFGANLVELEFMRYMPRRSLTRLLDNYDMVQIVCGSPAWGYVARDVRVPVALQVASPVQVERERRFEVERGPLAWWRKVMTVLTSRVEPRGLAVADAVLVENLLMYELASAQLGSERVVMAPPGIDIELFRPRDPVGGRCGRYILSVGRFGDPRKNVPLLFESYARLLRLLKEKAGQYTPDLVLAGISPPTDADWDVAERLGIRSHITYHPNVLHDTLAELYRNCEAFVLSSDEEGFGVVLIEAMASGVPVVSTACGGPDLIVEDGVTGFLVPVGDAEGLAAKLAFLLDRPEVTAQMGQHARKVSKEKYSLQASGRAYLETYDRLMGLGKSRGRS